MYRGCNACHRRLQLCLPTCIVPTSSSTRIRDAVCAERCFYIAEPRVAFRGGGVAGLILAVGLATLMAMAPGVFTLVAGWKGLPRAVSPKDAPSMWRRLLPYATALWTMNLLMNIFLLSDRYMIVHLLPAGGLDGLSAVGQYPSSRIIPLLFMSVATMFAGVLLPYLTADWEVGRKDAVRQSMRPLLSGVSIMLTLGAAVSL